MPGPDEPFDPRPILSALARHDVEFIVIGGVAAVLHGSPRVTWDLNICYRRDARNLESLVGALKAMNARLRGVSDDVPFVLDAKSLTMGDSFTFITEFGSFDILGTPSGSKGYDEMAKSVVEVELGGMKVLIASLDDLMKMKRAAGREKDRDGLIHLQALRDELDRDQGGPTGSSSG